MFSYTVRCSFTDQKTAQDWLAWLRDEHIQEVLNCGAQAAELFQMNEGFVYEIRYRFESKAAFEEYELHHAPRLRAKGLSRFPLQLGLEYSRTTGQLLWQRPS